jgi:sulfur-oxidizing protein SoxX
MLKKTSIAAALATATAVLLVAGGCATPDTGKTEAAKPAQDASAAKPAQDTPKPKAVDYTAMTPAALAEYLIFESGSYELDQPTQEGTNGRARLVQDEIQKICSLKKGEELSDEARAKVMALAAASIKYPEGGIKLGDWKKGRELAWSGFGYRTAHNPDKHAGREAGGNCYNCHELATDRTGGTIGLTLTGFGKIRGSGPDMLKYAYDMIYNANTYFPCTSMPRMGANGVLNQQQITDIMAYLFDPASPVNK